MLEKINALIKHEKFKKALSFTCAFAFLFLAGTIGANAQSSSSLLPTIDASFFDSILASLNQVVSVVMPFGLKVIGIMIAVGFVPRLIYKFV